MSQSFFVVEVTVFDGYGNLEQNWGSISNCGFSPIAMIFAVVAAALLMIITFALGFRKFKDGSPPTVGNCSAAMAAACHPPSRSDDMPFRDLAWSCRIIAPDVKHGFLAPT